VEQDGKTRHDYEVIGNVELLTPPQHHFQHLGV
jgi:hypothetical protein